jgi:hypothetical protein
MMKIFKTLLKFNIMKIMICRAEDVIQDISVEDNVNKVLQDVDTRTTPLHQEEVVPVMMYLLLHRQK